MSERVHTLPSKRTVLDASKLMAERKITSVLILDGSEIVGIITETDIVSRVVSKGLPVATKIGDVMSTRVITIPSSTTVLAAGKLMEENQIKKLPVVDDGMLKGIVTNTDLAKSMRRTIVEKIMEMLGMKTKYSIAGKRQAREQQEA